MATQDQKASLAIINYQALANKDAKEISRLVQACRTVGMFYLSLQESSLSTIFEDVPAILRVGHEFFNLPSDSEEKTESLRDGLERGYA